MTDTDLVADDPEGSPADAYDAADHLVSWDQLDELADRMGHLPDGDKEAAKAFYRELAS